MPITNDDLCPLRIIVFHVVLAGLHDKVSIKHTKCSRMASITQENPIGRPPLELIKPTLLQNKALTTKISEMAYSRCLPVHELIAHLVQEDHISPHVVHKHREPLKHGINRLTGEMRKILVLR
jgi:hypothetical protein